VRTISSSSAIRMRIFFVIEKAIAGDFKTCFRPRSRLKKQYEIYRTKLGP